MQLRLAPLRTPKNSAISVSSLGFLWFLPPFRSRPCSHVSLSVFPSRTEMFRDPSCRSELFKSERRPGFRLGIGPGVWTCPYVLIKTRKVKSRVVCFSSSTLKRIWVSGSIFKLSVKMRPLMGEAHTARAIGIKGIYIYIYVCILNMPASCTVSRESWADHW